MVRQIGRHRQQPRVIKGHVKATVRFYSRINQILYVTGRASILASCEPVAATVLGVLLYKEIPTVISVVGMVLILTAIILLSLFQNNQQPAQLELDNSS
ncbi:MAG: DMT family transporter [Clostridia bacterium]|nr:DMT family transporter [Clostridia bacterium]